MDTTQPQPILPVLPPLDDEARQLVALTHLEEDWDTYGAKRIGIDTIEIANRIIGQVAKKHNLRPTDIYPMNSGAVQIEWSGDAYLIVAEVNADVPLRYLLVTSDAGKRHAIEKSDATLDEFVCVVADLVNP